MYCQLKTYKEKLVTTSRKPLECRQIYIIQCTKLHEGSWCWKSECQVLFFVCANNTTRQYLKQNFAILWEGLDTSILYPRQKCKFKNLCWHLIFAPNRNQYKQTRWSLHRRSKTWFNRYFTVNLLFLFLSIFLCRSLK